jgi:hypothetical protein
MSEAIDQLNGSMIYAKDSLDRYSVSPTERYLKVLHRLILPYIVESGLDASFPLCYLGCHVLG